MKTMARLLVAVAVMALAGCGGNGQASCSLEGGVPLAASAWPKFRADKFNTGQSPADLSGLGGSLTAVWTVATGGVVSSSPAIGPDGEVYIGSADTKVYRINPDGVVAWQAATLNSVTSGPAIDTNGNVFVTSNDGNVYTLDSVNGEQDRPAVAIVGVLASPALADGANAGVLYLGSLSTGLFALCPNSILRWASQTVPVASTPAIDAAGNVYAAGAIGARTLTSLNPTNAQQNWIFTATAPINASPIVAGDGSVYIVDSAGRVFAVDAQTGTSGGVLYDTGAAVFASPALAANGVLYVADQSGTITAIDLDGEAPPPLWRFTIPSGMPIGSSPAVTADGTILFGADDGVVYALQDAGGSAELRWTFQTGAAVRSSPAVAEDGLGTIYVGSSDFNVYALRPL